MWKQERVSINKDKNKTALFGKLRGLWAMGHKRHGSHRSANGFLRGIRACYHHI